MRGQGLLFAISLMGCVAGGSDAVDPEESRSVEQPIFGGVSDNDQAANAAVVALKIGDAASDFELCTGAVIAPNVILTARHCVSVNIASTVSCDQNGRSGNGDHVGKDNAPSTIHVYSGATPTFGGSPLANGKAIFHPTGGVLCNADIALVVLDRKLSIAPLKVRLSPSTRTGETVKSVGYGRDEEDRAGRRLRKDAVTILATGTAISKSGTPLGNKEFEVGISICQGDSGGPAISSSTGAVVGVVSRGGDCSDDFGHIYTSTRGFEAMFKDAFTMAGSAPIDEGPGGDDGDGDGLDGDGTAKNLDLQSNHNSGGCSAGGVPGPEATSLGGIGLGGLIAFALLFTRRKRGGESRGDTAATDATDAT